MWKKNELEIISEAGPSARGRPNADALVPYEKLSVSRFSHTLYFHALDHAFYSVQAVQHAASLFSSLSVYFSPPPLPSSTPPRRHRFSLYCRAHVRRSRVSRRNLAAPRSPIGSIIIPFYLHQASGLAALGRRRVARSRKRYNSPRWSAFSI